MASPGTKLRSLAASGPAQVAGAVNAYCAMLAERAGMPAVYLSGGGVAACSGMPDVGVNTLADVAGEAARIADATSLPLLVDADTGFGNTLSVERTARTLAKAGAAGMHLEDQDADKRCGHRPNKRLCPAAEMCDRIRAACDGRGDDSFVVMARTDALANEGMAGALERAGAYREAGADMLFLEGAASAGQYAEAAAAGMPVLANITEFGVTPLLGLDELAANRVALVLYPLTAFRMMMRAAEEAYVALRADGSQQALLPRMQTREELYERLGYHRLEQLMDRRQKAEA